MAERLQGNISPSALCRQLIHLYDPLTDVDGSPVITLAFWADVDDIDSPEPQSSACSHEILSCVRLDDNALSPSSYEDGHSGTIQATEGE